MVARLSIFSLYRMQCTLTVNGRTAVVLRTAVAIYGMYSHTGTAVPMQYRVDLQEAGSVCADRGFSAVDYLTLWLATRLRLKALQLPVDQEYFHFLVRILDASSWLH